ncbi:hypothetical protein MTR67_052687 [Solanum verrucosum]|uniref:Uncharacterized protein n=1 Tax=Solanum verrucosum TaxID=315347 RepID=A0AAF0V6L2_SOLVR|nr:hypothetical protein MTR67_052687 [Solanum verrucosum]
MARPFIRPPLAPAKAEAPQRPELPFQNKFTALAEYPRLPCPLQSQPPKLPCSPQPKLINLRPTKLFDKGASSSSSIQTKESYSMKTPEFFAQDVNPELTKTFLKLQLLIEKKKLLILLFHRFCLSWHLTKNLAILIQDILSELATQIPIWWILTIHLREDNFMKSFLLIPIQ